jgi:hypothetical protein
MRAPAAGFSLGAKIAGSRSPPFGFDVAAWVKELQGEHGAPGVKQQLAAVRMLFDWLVTARWCR